MNEVDQALIEAAKDGLESRKMVMVAIRGLQATQILDIQLSSDALLVSMTCPANDEFGIGKSILSIRANDLLGVSVSA